MDFELVAIALGDVTWITLAFFLGFMVRTVGLPPLVGFLATGFVLNYMGMIFGTPKTNILQCVIFREI